MYVLKGLRISRAGSAKCSRRKSRVLRGRWTGISRVYKLLKCITDLQSMLASLGTCMIFEDYLGEVFCFCKRHIIKQKLFLLKSFLIR